MVHNVKINTVKRILEEIIDRNTGGNYLLSSSDKTQMINEILDLFGAIKEIDIKSVCPKCASEDVIWTCYCNRCQECM